MAPNVGGRDQAVRIALGTLLFAGGLARGRRLAALAGLGLLASAVTRRCPLNRLMGVNTFQNPEPHLAGSSKPLVQETSEESFPASDPPAWTGLA